MTVVIKDLAGIKVFEKSATSLLKCFMTVANHRKKTIERHCNKWLEINTVSSLSKASQTFMFKKVLISIQKSNNGIMLYSTWLYCQIKLAFSLENKYFTIGVRGLKKRLELLSHGCTPQSTSDHCNIHLYKRHSFKIGTQDWFSLCGWPLTFMI